MSGFIKCHLCGRTETVKDNETPVEAVKEIKWSVLSNIKDEDELLVAFLVCPDCIGFLSKGQGRMATVKSHGTGCGRVKMAGSRIGETVIIIEEEKQDD